MRERLDIIFALALIIFNRCLDALKEAWDGIKEHFHSYGLFILAYLILNIFALSACKIYFPWVFLGLPALLFVLIKNPVELFYVLVGRGYSLKSFSVGFIIVQLIFIALYSYYLNSYGIAPAPDENIIKLSQLRANCMKYVPFDSWLIAENTFLTALMSEPYQQFSAVISDRTNDELKYFWIIVVVQIGMSWIFLGIFISSVYQKFRKE